MAPDGVLQLARAELEAAQRDLDSQWPSLVANDQYEIDDPPPPEQAKELVLDLLWDTYYPGLPARRGDADYQAFDVNEGPERWGMLEQRSTGQKVALIRNLTRDGDQLKVRYDALDAKLHPAALRKHLRAALREFAER